VRKPRPDRDPQSKAADGLGGPEPSVGILEPRHGANSGSMLGASCDFNHKPCRSGVVTLTLNNQSVNRSPRLNATIRLDSPKSQTGGGGPSSRLRGGPLRKRSLVPTRLRQCLRIEVEFQKNWDRLYPRMAAVLEF